MEDNKDKSERLKHLNVELEKQKKKLKEVQEKLGELKTLPEFYEKDIEYNKRWIKFNEVSIEEHKKKIKETPYLEEKEDQERKLAFHIRQIEEHHKKSISYSEKELILLKKWISLYEEIIPHSQEQIGYLNLKIEENNLENSGQGIYRE